MIGNGKGLHGQFILGWILHDLSKKPIPALHDLVRTGILKKFIQRIYEIYRNITSW
jgi:hypothetical protein